MNDDERRSKFVELAEKRVTRTIKDIRLIGNLANKSNYSYSEADVRKIMAALRQEVEALGSKFKSPGRTSEILFKLEK